jgi:hypothetical protein
MAPPHPAPPYRTSSWSGQRRGFPKRTARRILDRDAATCQLGFTGCTITATEADHITGWADAMAAGWDPADVDDIGNGQAVCAGCHRRKTLGEQAAGRQRNATQRARRLPAEKHPGLL